MLLSLAGELKLEEDQVKSIQEIGFALQKEVIRKKADRSIAGVELNALMCQDEIDLEQVQQKIQQMATLEGELRIAQIKASIEAKKVLTEEQQAKVKELMMKKPAAIPKKTAAQKEKKAEKEPMH
jgi:Spy/CpxP family protein refolding chaperone